MLAHDELLVRLNFQIGTRAGGAEENESGRAVFGKVGYGIARVEVSCAQQSSCTREAATLMADGRQLNSRDVCCVPDVFIFSDVQFPY